MLCKNIPDLTGRNGQRSCVEMELFHMLGRIPVRAKNMCLGLGKEYFQYSGLEFMYWFAAATNSFTTVYLQDIGMDSTEVGMISALNSAVSILAMPLWGALSDKLRSIKKVFLFATLVSALIVPLIPMISAYRLGPVLLAYLIIPLSCFFRTPTGALVDSWVVQAANRQGLNYGGVRLWGSISLAVMSMALSGLLPLLGIRYAFFGFSIVAVPLMLVAFSIKDDAKKGKSLSLREMHVGELFKNYYYMAYLVFAIALNIPLNCSYTFMPYLIKSVGADPSLYGILTGYKALMEIPMLILMVHLRKRFRMPHIIVAAGIFYVLEMTLYSFAGNFAHLFFIITFQGIGGGLFIGVGTNYVYSLAPDHLKATAQTLNGAMNSVAGIIGNLLGGVLIAMVGVKAFYFIAGCMIFGAVVLFLLSFPLGQRILKPPLPNAARRPRALLCEQAST